MPGLDEFQVIEDTPEAKASIAQVGEVATVTTISSPRRGPSKHTKISPSGKERKKSIKESPSGATLDTLVVQEGAKTATRDDDEEQFSQLCPRTVHPSKSIGLVIRIEGEVSVPSTAAVRPSPNTVQEVTEENQKATNISAETSSNVAVEIETATQQTNDDEVQIIGESQRPNSSSVMI